jgi:tetratricopeptide (TPR) repeat protein
MPSPIHVTLRQAVPASTTAIAACMKYKASGAEMFKLGRYSEADTAYSSAISTLPGNHLLQVQLHNNRALSRLKIGEHSGTIVDCSFVISLIGPSYHPQREVKLTGENEGSGVDLSDGLMKAYKRRAEAYEGRERWEDARKDWEAIVGTDWANWKLRNEAISGIGRCRKMLNPQMEQVASKPKPPVKRPPPKAAIRGATPPSEALAKLRAVTDATEAEDQAKHELKDAVDAKVNAWKGGKEQNIRALIASLEHVLWPELNWQKVGMHELVAPNQVKIRYTKAIAKLHPDKVRKDTVAFPLAH